MSRKGLTTEQPQRQSCGLLHSWLSVRWQVSREQLGAEGDGGGTHSCSQDIQVHGVTSLWQSPGPWVTVFHLNQLICLGPNYTLISAALPWLTAEATSRVSSSCFLKQSTLLCSGGLAHQAAWTRKLLASSCYADWKLSEAHFWHSATITPSQPYLSFFMSKWKCVVIWWCVCIKDNEKAVIAHLVDSLLQCSQSIPHTHTLSFEMPCGAVYTLVFVVYN